MELVLTAEQRTKLFNKVIQTFQAKKIGNETLAKVYVELLQRQYESGEYFNRSMKELSKLCNVPEKTISNVLKELETLGLIERTGGTTTKNVDTYGKTTFRSSPSTIRLTNTIIDVPMLWYDVLLRN